MEFLANGNPATHFKSRDLASLLLIFTPEFYVCRLHYRQKGEPWQFARRPSTSYAKSEML
jgi:hypothetical protein